MAVQEPVGPLWAAVKAIYDPWPVDDEAAAADVAGAWRNGGTVLAQGTQGATRAGEASLAAWRDAAGEQFHGRVGRFAAGMEQLQQNVANRAAHAEYYGTELASAKNAIVTTIAQNERGYADLGTARYGAAGPGLQNAFAAKVAADLQQMIATKAAALRAYPAAAAPVSTFAGNQAADPPDVNRPLTPEELDIARAVFGDTLDLTNVRVKDGGGITGNLADLDDKARTVGSEIIFPAGTLTRAANDARYREAYFEPWLVHELAHVWQYQHGATLDSLLPTAVAGGLFKQVYDFGDLGQAKEAGKPFLRFNSEQQANIVSAYYAMNRTAEITDPENPYRHYVDEVRRVPRGEQVIIPPPPTPII